MKLTHKRLRKYNSVNCCVWRAVSTTAWLEEGEPGKRGQTGGGVSITSRKTISPRAENPYNNTQE